MELDITQLLEAIGVKGPQLHIISLHSRGVVNDEGTINVAQVTPFDIKAAFTRAQMIKIADDEGMDLNDEQDRADAKQMVQQRIKPLQVASEEYKQIDGVAVYQMEFQDSWVFFGLAPFDLAKWHAHFNPSVQY